MSMVIKECFACAGEVFTVRLQKHHTAPSVHNSSLSDEAKFLVGYVVTVCRHQMRWVLNYLV